MFRYTLFDVESDGLLDEITKIHCLSYQIFEDGVLVDSGSITTYDKMREFLEKQKYLVGHNIIRYDIPALIKIIGDFEVPKLIDTLGLSWYLYPYRKRHGLEWWGEEFGVPKPKVEDWKNLRIAQYIFRCEQDVRINAELFHKQLEYLHSIYSANIANIRRIIGYLNYKLDCIKDQEEVGIFLDQQLCDRTQLNLEFIYEEKIEGLQESMPQSVANIKKSKPKVMHKKDGSLSHYGQRWMEALAELGLPEDTEVIYEKPNPASTTQLKKWLMLLGWEPITFKMSKSTGELVPQVSLPFGQGVCPSVKALYLKAEGLVNLEGLYVAKHRIGLLKSFKSNVKPNGFIYASAHGFTNTLRLQHRVPVVNLPGVKKDYGKEIRGCLTVPNEDYIMCGSDISGLEDNTKQHYIYFFDPDYVDEMRVPGFDPHIDIALVGKMITQDQADFYRWYDSDRKIGTCPVIYQTYNEEEMLGLFKFIKEIRGDAKVVNFSATYGAGAAKIAETLKKPLADGQKLHTTYWERNKAVKKTADACVVKKFEGQKWLYNPVSGFWMFLKEDKDKFSTLNQSTGVYVFDTWVRHVRTSLKPLGIKICMQYHDELLLWCKKSLKPQVKTIILESMKQTNLELNLNVNIGCSIDWGTNYADCH